jgi:L-rhamnonate dehydratase
VNDPVIIRIELGVLEGTRPRHAGRNARLGDHGSTVRVSLARLTTDDGVVGFGVCRATPEQLEPLVGSRLSDAFHPERGPVEAWVACEFPLWDLVAKRTGQPVYALAAGMAGVAASEPFEVPCYDTSLYFDDLHLERESDAADLIAAEAMEGFERGHRVFKIKVGRGARHMPLEEGTRRDIAIVHAVRAAVGPEPPIMLDANNGYNLNLTKRVLAETADCDILWMEEPFHEDAELYRDLRVWMINEGLDVLIADGEGQASPSLLDWAKEGVVDVVQYDIFSHGFTKWLATGRQLDTWGRRTAPHHYGGHYGNYAAGHLASGVRNFAFVEWDEVTTPGIEVSNYKIVDGRVQLPATPGFSLGLDEERFQHAVATTGFTVSERST